MKRTMVSMLPVVMMALGCQTAASTGAPGAAAQAVDSVDAGVADAADVSDASAGADANSDAGPPTACPAGAPGPAMVEFETPAGVRYCMDQTEVSQRHYADFLAAKVGAETQAHPLCAPEKNPEFGPRVVEPRCGIAGDGKDYGLCTEGVFDPETRGDLPMTCVEFCDAVAYCAWAGKRLCGAPGKPGRTFGDGFDPASEFRRALAPEANHWQNACSQRGSAERAYAASFDVNRCSGPRTVGSRPECATQGTNGAAYDLMGGVAEWQDSCTDDRHCRILGGMSGRGPERGSCGQDAATSAGAASRSIGFRCCLDLAPEKERG